MTFRNLFKLFACACCAVQLAACDFGGEGPADTTQDETTSPRLERPNRTTGAGSGETTNTNPDETSSTKPDESTSTNSDETTNTNSDETTNTNSDETTSANSDETTGAGSDETAGASTGETGANSSEDGTQTGNETAADETKPSGSVTVEAPPPAPSADVFGVAMIYPSKPGGESWAMNDDPMGDARFDPGDPLTRNSDGSFKMKAGQVRLNVFTSEGYRPSAIKTYDREVLAAQGYMQSQRDWKNVEITGYVKTNKIEDAADNFAWYARGGRHNDAMPCEGSAYKADLHYDGRVRMAKENWHVSYDYTGYKNAVSPLQGRWVGFKTAIRNVEVGGKTAVKVESWVDDRADGKSFVKVFEFVDDGTWAGNSAQCGAKDTKAPLVWGGPTTTFRWDNASDVDVKWLSVREITP